MTILLSAPLPCYTLRMKKWFKEDFEWDVEVTGFLRGSETEGYCRNGTPPLAESPLGQAAALRRSWKFLLGGQKIFV